jgi:hypothetical protein
MSNMYVNRILSRQFLGYSGLGDLLSSVADATATNNPGSKIFVQDLSGNHVSMVYANTTNLTSIAVGVPMYWTNAARTIVSDTVTSALTYVASSQGAIQSAAGVGLNASLTTAVPYGWFQCGGVLAAVPVPSSALVGDKLVLSNAAGTAPSNDVWTRVGLATAVATPETVTTLYAVCTTATASTSTTTAWIMGTCGLS